MALSIIVPTLNEAAYIEATLVRLAPLRARGAEVIVVDGGSSDATRAFAAPHADRVLAAPRGRAAQLNAGAQAATGDALWFLHADSLAPADADRAIAQALAAGRAWGRFDVAIRGRSALLPVIAWCMNLRSRATGIATGDQGMFMTRTAFRAAGGFPAIALMEDIAMSRALKRLGRPACLKERIETSGRRWDSRGAMATILLMWRLRLAFFLGADPAELEPRYDGRHD